MDPHRDLSRPQTRGNSFDPIHVEQEIMAKLHAVPEQGHTGKDRCTHQDHGVPLQLAVRVVLQKEKARQDQTSQNRIGKQILGNRKMPVHTYGNLMNLGPFRQVTGKLQMFHCT